MCLGIARYIVDRQKSHSQVANSRVHISICYCAKLSSPLHHVNCPNGLQAAHKFLSFYAVQGLNVFSDLPKSLPEKIGLPCFLFVSSIGYLFQIFIKLVKFFISLIYSTLLVM
jgi:hypothetical protein